MESHPLSTLESPPFLQTRDPRRHARFFTGHDAWRIEFINTIDGSAGDA
jgi:hypothetical protein